MAYTTIKKPSDYFNTKLYSADATNTINITGVGHQPDWVWIKRRNGTSDHVLFDSVRGTQKGLFSSLTNAEATEGGNRGLTSFDSDGFTIGPQLQDISGSINAPSGTYASWNWKAGGTAVSNTDGSISSTVSANTTSGFSIVSWNGSDANATIGHGLGSAPRVIFIKNRESAEQWYVYHESMGNGNKLTLNDASTASSAADWWQDTSPTNQVFYVSGVDGINGPHEMIAYCFAEKQGYSKFGSYVGNSSTDGTFVYTGFLPSFVIIKNIDAGESWSMFDGKRPDSNQTNGLYQLQPNTSSAEYQGAPLIDFVSNGFKLRTATDSLNVSQNYIYMAFAEQPLVGDNPATAR